MDEAKILQGQPAPRREPTRQELILDRHMRQLEELKLRIRGRKNCTEGCHGTGVLGIRTVQLVDGFWEPYLQTCKCAMPSAYDILYRRMEAMHRETFEELWKWTFWGGLVYVPMKTVLFVWSMARLFWWRVFPPQIKFKEPADAESERP